MNTQYQYQNYPGQPMYSNQGGQPIFVTQPVIMAPMFFGSYPQSTTCHNCKASIVTRTSHETGGGTWLIAGVLCLVGLWCGCQFIPFCMDACKDVKHYCPNCNHFLGMKRVL